ncbi:MAG: cyanophycinase [Gemmataceae bacterium]
MAPVPGALVIAGGGTLPAEARSEFVRLAGGKGKAKIVVIPTASADADDLAKYESFTKPWEEAGAASVALVHATKGLADNPAVLVPLKEATGVWFSGDQTRLTKAYRGTAVEAEVQKVLARGGVVGGTSAGAAVMSDLMIEGGNPTAKVGPGFGFLPGVVVDQHFTQRKRIDRLRGVLDTNPGTVGLGIDEGTAVIVTRGRLLKVVGEGTVTACWARSASRPAAEEVVKAGGTFDLFQLRRAAAARAAKEPFPPVSPADPVVPKGALVIVGGGGLPNEVVERFIELAGGKDAPLIVVPTAQDDPLAADHPEARLFKRHGMADVTVLHTRDRKLVDDPEFSKPLLKAKAVWFGGGRQWRFVDAYEGTLTERRFREVLARGGVIGGSSAGASIQSEYMPRGHPLGNTVVMAEGYERGFGYLPGAAVDQHFFARKRTGDMEKLMAAYPKLLGVGIDEGTAVVVAGSTAEVIGKSKVAFFDWRAGRPDGSAWTEVPSGRRYDLKARALIDP